MATTARLPHRGIEVVEVELKYDAFAHMRFGVGDDRPPTDRNHAPRRRRHAVEDLAENLLLHLAEGLLGGLNQSMPPGVACESSGSGSGPLWRTGGGCSRKSGTSARRPCRSGAGATRPHPAASSGAASRSSRSQRGSASCERSRYWRSRQAVGERYGMITGNELARRRRADETQLIAERGESCPRAGRGQAGFRRTGDRRGGFAGRLRRTEQQSLEQTEQTHNSTGGEAAGGIGADRLRSGVGTGRRCDGCRGDAGDDEPQAAQRIRGELIAPHDCGETNSRDEMLSTLLPWGIPTASRRTKLGRPAGRPPRDATASQKGRRGGNSTPGGGRNRGVLRRVGASELQLRCPQERTLRSPTTVAVGESR